MHLSLKCLSLCVSDLAEQSWTLKLAAMNAVLALKEWREVVKRNASMPSTLYRGDEVQEAKPAALGGVDCWYYLKSGGIGMPLTATLAPRTISASVDARVLIARKPPPRPLVMVRTD